MRFYFTIALAFTFVINPYLEVCQAACYRVVIIPANTNSNTCTKNCAGLITLNQCAGARVEYFNREECQDVPAGSPANSGFDVKQEVDATAYNVYNCETDWIVTALLGLLAANYFIGLACTLACVGVPVAGCIACLIIAVEAGLLSIVALCGCFQCVTPTTASSSGTYKKCTPMAGNNCPVAT